MREVCRSAMSSVREEGKCLDVTVMPTSVSCGCVRRDDDRCKGNEERRVCGMLVTLRKRVEKEG